MKKRLGIIFGGRSSEHEVSVTSVQSVVGAVDSNTYDIELIYITPGGKWIAGQPARNILDGSAAPEDADELIVPANPGENRPVAFPLDGSPAKRLAKLDVVFPVLHGWYGEDGTIQGLFELAGIPYVGAGVAASAVGMDKSLMKKVFAAYKLPIVDYICNLRSVWKNDPGGVIKQIEDRFSYPLFVKPANTGSSVGISKVHGKGELSAAIDFACEFDRKFIVERGLDVREIECSVLGNDRPEASVPGEIAPSREFYDYDAKYVDETSKLTIPAELTEEQADTVRALAVHAFKAIDCAGMARVDLFLDRETETFFVNEINTIPGFTPISMYPKLWEAGGLSYPALVDRLIGLAFERHADRAACRTKY